MGACQCFSVASPSQQNTFMEANDAIEATEHFQDVRVPKSTLPTLLAHRVRKASPERPARSPKAEEGLGASSSKEGKPRLLLPIPSKSKQGGRWFRREVDTCEIGKCEEMPSHSKGPIWGSNCCCCDSGKATSLESATNMTSVISHHQPD
ncbi:unnamed protein product [Cladocopium goreaui]|uniref:Uncharacterized protein n=1 Tax=Cladocopium goreaui TaxID=2562237 RepID=A0A9P1G3B3_9DINO|nr:unnamed protein product [Cladocopium goreaui]